MVMAEDDEVGYGKPPKHSRFKKGQSGNPKGRPKGKKNRTTVITAMLDEVTTVMEGGKARRMTKLEIIVAVLINKALKGDKKAIDMVLQLQRETQFGEAAAPGGTGVLKVPGMVGADVWEDLARRHGLDKKEADDES
jgi:hypothetical protein